MGQGESKISEEGISWITGDNPPLVLQSIEGELHHLQLTVPLAPQEDKEQQSEQPLAETTLLYSGRLTSCWRTKKSAQLKQKLTS
jgi:hypothetical protein